MIRKLQFLLTALLLMVGVTSAWADDYDGTSAIYNSTQGKNYSSLATAVSEATAGDVIVLYEDITLDSKCIISKSITIKVGSGKSVTIKYGTKDGTRGSSLLALGGVASGTLTIDGSDGTLVIDDNYAGNASNSIEVAPASGENVYLKNLTIQNSRQKSCLYFKQNGNLYLTNITFKNGRNSEGALFLMRDACYLDGEIVFDNCTTDISVGGDLKGFYAVKTAGTLTLSFPSNPYITMKLDDANRTTTTTGKWVVQNTAAFTNRIRFTNNGWYPETSGTGTVAKKITTSYTLTVTSAGMSTLVLPFNVTLLPSGVTAYTLENKETYIQATEVESITKDKPVLIVANAGNYVFNSDDATIANYSSEAPTYDNLVGTYKEIDADEGNYVLQKHGDKVGFYKLADGSNKVIKQFRAYLTPYSGPTPAPSLSIVFDNSTTGIRDAINDKGQMEGSKDYYDLQGRRVANPTKGLYIVNGKKVVIK